MGGKSIEKEVSFNSGRTICDHLDTQQYDVIPLFQTQENKLYILPCHFLHRGKINDFLARLPKEASAIKWDDLKDLVDFVYLAMHGRYGEDGTVQGFLEVLTIPYLGSKVLASATGMDKIIQKDFLRAQNITVANDIVVTPEQIYGGEEYLNNILASLDQKGIKFPCVVKPHKEGSSLGISIVNTPEQLLQALQKACFINPLIPQKVLIEEKIEGMEFSCIVITDYLSGNLMPLPPTEVVPDSTLDFFDYEQKYMPGRATEFTPARVDQETIGKIQGTCIAVMKCLDMSNLARIDGFVTASGTIVITDPNSLSGMAPTSFLFREAAYIGKSHTSLINHLIETELYMHGMLNSSVAREQITMKSTKKIRVGVLFGGASNEREISLESGRNVVYKLSPHKYEPIAIFVTPTMELYQLNQQQLVLNSTREIIQTLTPDTKILWHDLERLVDFVFIGLHGGAGENGSVQGTLEMLGIPYNGSGVFTSALCMDKFKTNQFLKTKGFDIPAALLVEKQSWYISKDSLLKIILQKVSFPMVVKPHDDGCSVMVQKVKNEESLIAAIEHIFSQQKDCALVEEYISGMELTVGVMGNQEPRALPPSQAVCAAEILSMEEKFLPGAGENQTPAPLPAAALLFVQKTMETAYKVLGCRGYVRIDCFYQSATESATGNERVILLEINTLPALTPATCFFHQAAEIGMKPMDCIDLIITLGLEEHKYLVDGIDARQKLLHKSPPIFSK